MSTWSTVNAVQEVHWPFYIHVHSKKHIPKCKDKLYNNLKDQKSTKQPPTQPQQVHWLKIAAQQSQHQQPFNDIKHTCIGITRIKVSRISACSAVIKIWNISMSTPL